MPARISIGYGTSNESYVVSKPIDIKQKNLASLLRATGAESASRFDGFDGGVGTERHTKGRVKYGEKYFLHNPDQEKLREFLERHGQRML